MRKLLVVAAGLVVFALPTGVSAWAMDVHRLITRRAIEALPAELKPFFNARIDFIVEHSVDPDLWRILNLKSDLGTEDPNHFLDYDGFKDPFPFKNVPTESFNAVVQKYGEELATKNGRLPWRTEEVFNKLTELFVQIGKNTAPYGGDNGRYLVAVLGHYIEDAHVPFHGVENHNGQLTGQTGIHSRFESELVLRNKATLKLLPVTITPIPDIKAFIFKTLLDDQQLAKDVLAADKKATEGREFYDDGYYKAFAENGALKVAEQRFSQAASALTSAIVASWEKAGKPKMPVDTPRTPARIRR
jgi:hypothetical protein